MTTNLRYFFPAGNTQDVCILQSTLGVTNAVLNGNLANSNHTAVSFIANNYSRQISITSSNNLNSITFTIGGTQNGVTISETITGPNAATVYSTLIYDTITFISTSAAATGFSVGSGYNGYFPLITIDRAQNVSNYTLSLGATIGSNQITTTVYSTLDNIGPTVAVPVTFQNTIANNIGTLTTVKAATAVSLYVYPVSPVTTVPLVNQILVALTGSSSTIGNGVTLLYLQN